MQYYNMHESVKRKLTISRKSHEGLWQPAFTCSKSAIEILKQYVKSVQI